MNLILRAAFLAALLAASVPAGAIELSSRAGVQEIVVSVKNLNSATAVYREVAGYEVKSESVADPLLAAAWDLPSGTPIRERVLGVPGVDKGFLRLVEIGGLPQVQIRSSARPFDTGGIFNFNTLVKDMDAVFEGLRDHGFQGFADPTRYTIFGRRYGGAMVRGHDGVVINLLERVDQPYDDVPPFTAMSHIVNATQMVTNYDVSFEFFTKRLGWQVRWEASPTWPPDGSNNMGLPNSLLRAGAVKERAASFTPSKDAEGGTIEIFQFEGVSGIDFSARAKPPNLGALSYRIHTPGLAAYAAAIAARGVVILEPPTTLTMAPYGRVDVMIVAAPDGAWLEFFEQRK